MNVPPAVAAPAPSTQSADPVAVGTAFRQAADLFHDANVILQRGKQVNVVARNGQLSDPIELTHAGGKLLEQAVAGFAELYPRDDFRIAAFRGAAAVAQASTAADDLPRRLDRWATYSQGTSDFILMSLPGFGEFRPSPLRPTIIVDATSRPDPDKVW